MSLVLTPDQVQVLRNENGEPNAYAYKQTDSELLTVIGGIVLGVPLELDATGEPVSYDEVGNPSAPVATLVFDHDFPQEALQTLGSRAVTRGSVMAEITESTPLDSFLAWEPGLDVAIDDVLTYGDALYRVVQAHTTQADWTPDATPALFVRYFDPAEGPQPWVQPTGAHDAYNIGDRVLFEGSVYESLIDANVWSPTANPAGWQLIG